MGYMATRIYIQLLETGEQPHASAGRLPVAPATAGREQHPSWLKKGWWNLDIYHARTCRSVPVGAGLGVWLFIVSYKRGGGPSLSLGSYLGIQLAALEIFYLLRQILIA